MRKIAASEVMTRHVLTVAPDWPTSRLVEFLADHAISGAPVVAEDKTPLGVVSLTDVARSDVFVERPADEAHAYYRQGLDRLVAREELGNYRVSMDSTKTVRDSMTPMIFSVEEAAPVQEVADAMVRGRIHRVFVTRHGKMVGVISAMDLLPLVRDM